jgi:multidrug resistance efflux pump
LGQNFHRDKKIHIAETSFTYGDLERYYSLVPHGRMEQQRVDMQATIDRYLADYQRELAASHAARQEVARLTEELSRVRRELNKATGEIRTTGFPA